MITQARLKELFDYDPATGIFTRRVATSNRVKPGAPVGVRNGNGYFRMQADNKRYYCHRLAWLYVYGTIPKHQIDHINGDPSDNRICNLREASNLENHQNIRAHQDNKSGYLGVSWYPKIKKWSAEIMHEGIKYKLGMFDDPKEAHAAYLAKKQELHPFSTIL